MYIKPNSVYKRRAFSSLKQRKRRDLVAVGFNVFHKICDVRSVGAAEVEYAVVAAMQYRTPTAMSRNLSTVCILTLI